MPKLSQNGIQENPIARCMVASHHCPCGTSLPYDHCCGRIHNQPTLATSAEALMRARYSAFEMRLPQYLYDTLHPDQRCEDELLKLEDSINSTEWLSLRILSASETQVEFIAFYKASPVGQLHESSRFLFEGDRWYYVDGDVLPSVKLGRNDPCPCGSGKKIKQCCKIY